LEALVFLFVHAGLFCKRAFADSPVLGKVKRVMLSGIIPEDEHGDVKRGWGDMKKNPERRENI
jgi:hypothetical protein